MRAYLFMWRVCVLTGVYLFAFYAFLWGQTPPVTVDLAKAELYWTWTQGTSGPVEKWVIRCGPTPTNFTIMREIATPAARAYLIKDLPLTVGTWTCVVAGANTFGAGPASPSVTFQAGQAPGAVDSLGIR